MEKIITKETEQLYEAILKLRTKEECEAFFEDICTIREVMDMTLRLQVAAMLDDGKGYQEISKETGASTATICRVNKCLVYGSGGYRNVLDRIKNSAEPQPEGSKQ